jgi:hypothetical protein
VADVVDAFIVQVKFDERTDGWTDGKKGGLTDGLSDKQPN